MFRSKLTLLALLLTVGACGTVRDSRLNPFNWFGRSQAAGPSTLAVSEDPAVTDNRALVAQVTRMQVNPMPGGAIVQAVGLPPTQGWWDADLVAENDGVPDENGVLTLRFVVAEPRRKQAVSTQQSREVTAGLFLSDQDLEPVRRIVVTGAGNSRVASR
ncbi:MAG: hypothetical protein ACRCSU_01685 [Paracoccaceae bacterium]